MKKAVIQEILETIAGLCIIAGGISIAKQSLITTILCFVLGLVIIPFSTKFIKDKYNKQIPEQLRTILIYALTLTIALTFKTVNPQTDDFKNLFRNTPTKTPKETTEATTSTPPNIAVNKEGPYNVIKVIDGDTLDISIDNKTVKVRVIGLNTPETVDPRKPVECFGKQASAEALKVLQNKKVYLESDDSQQNRDKYDRLLRYVWLENGTNFSKYMIENGFGYEYTYDIPYKYQEEFNQAQKTAETAKTGLWADSACTTTK
jgi:micrococcal nuclease